ncbi:NAD+ synthase [Acidihalobacter yilgarnensis]|uniref:Glutamine-dependent NAD(+) synthetase n=1 Tax=Acidihalobacter yilgarnensis TaxID=2819280 RepID=A0A1D8IR59_9GAMM|nr:NAD+ synthase [Acidihalobacter yilgarnensis]AOU98979.1 NAD+ synthase [Acidihalobacter yilgarnensis]
MSTALRIVLAQCNPLVGDVEGNARMILEQVRLARERMDAQLILFPELALTGYPPEDLLLRASLLGQVEAALAAIAPLIDDCHIVIGAPYRDDVGLRNGAVVLGNGREIARYAKRCLPNYSVFDEKRYFVEGTQPCVVSVAGISVGLTVCEDIWYPEPARSTCDAGAELLVNINASPFHASKYSERLETLRMRVAETGLPLIYVNQVGGQDELLFDGQSLALDGSGALILRAPSFETGLYLVPHAGGGEVTELASLEDREADAYRALVLGVRDYVRKNGFPGAVIGLSGGIDSALTLAIAVDALGAEDVLAVMMPSRYTAPMSLEDARIQCANLGVQALEIPIERPFQAFLGVLEPLLAGRPPDATEENIQARCRGVILMAISNKTGRMVLTTGNKSEMAVGYATLYGDMAGGFAPLKDVPKTLVYRLAHWRNREQSVIPERVLTRPPSAELAPDQKDSDSLPPYEVLDPILEYFVERDWSISEIVTAGYDREVVERVVGLVLHNEYKRRQAPPGVRISPRAFGKDRRYPITSGYGRAIR